MQQNAHIPYRLHCPMALTKEQMPNMQETHHICKLQEIEERIQSNLCVNHARHDLMTIINCLIYQRLQL